MCRNKAHEVHKTSEAWRAAPFVLLGANELVIYSPAIPSVAFELDAAPDFH